jgi:hypothetical protein
VRIKPFVTLPDTFLLRLGPARIGSIYFFSQLYLGHWVKNNHSPVKCNEYMYIYLYIIIFDIGLYVCSRTLESPCPVHGEGDEFETMRCGAGESLSGRWRTVVIAINQRVVKI